MSLFNTSCDCSHSQEILIYRNFLAMTTDSSPLAEKGETTMSKAVSRGQALEISARVATQINWDELDGDKLQVEVINLSSAEFGSRFTAFLKNGGRPQVIGAVNFPIWKTVKLGTGLADACKFREALKNGGFRIGDWGNYTLGGPDFKVSPKKTSIGLVNVSVAEIGFKDGATRKDIYERALSLGLQLCPNEVGPQLRLQYKDQPKGEGLPIAMEPIAGSGGYLGVFYVGRRDDDLWLDGSIGRPGVFWFGRVRWVFARRK
ncbi:MAG: hypothetical protein CEN90_368 [Parcubacteria group bacterium Licking1014_17]|nr:MAG: hypothetical protein CEN90_368 [Parcubacteria group bacterium Licking1014_17]